MNGITRNIDQMAAEVSEHIAQDRVIQGTYWNRKTERGCFIGCLGHSAADAAVARLAARRRQRDTLLALIAQAPVVEVPQ
mgnify:CR=1 FL=1